MSTATPSYLGSYRLLNVVNTGQTSQMWQAYHDGRQSFFAIKTLLERFRSDREHLGYLRCEYTVGAKLIHDRIIKIEEYGVDRSSRFPYLAMEWFAAPNMKQRMRSEDEIERLLPTIIPQATEALVYFAQQGWVHRDIKPDNFLVDDEGNVKLIDFALARRRQNALQRLLPVKSKIQGTRSYMSPEQIRGEWLDDRADLYSFGCTLFELVGGRPPFTGASSDDLLKRHLKAPPPALEAANRNVTPEFAHLIRRTMAKKRGDRPKSIADFQTELRGIRIFRRDPSRAKQTDTPSE